MKFVIMINAIEVRDSSSTNRLLSITLTEDSKGTEIQFEIVVGESLTYFYHCDEIHLTSLFNPSFYQDKCMLQV